MLDYKIIGKRLKEARKEKGLTQNELTKELGMSVAFLSRIEKGNAHINLKRLSQICNILDISEGEILNGVANESKNYLEKEFQEIFKLCSKEQKTLIYRIAKTIIETNMEG